MPARYNLTKHEAEQLLDWLEANGRQGVELRSDGASYTVRWPEEPRRVELRIDGDLVRIAE